MSFTYTADPLNTPLDAVRFLIGDVDTSEPQLQDGEIEWLIELWSPKGSLYYPASMAAEAIAAKYSREVTVSADSQSVGMGELQQKYLGLADRLLTQHQQLLAGGLVDAGGVTIGEQPDQTVRPLAFGRAMHDNIEAGRQDYGGEGLQVWLPEINGF